MFDSVKTFAHKIIHG